MVPVAEVQVFRVLWVFVGFFCLVWLLFFFSGNSLESILRSTLLLQMHKPPGEAQGCQKGNSSESVSPPSPAVGAERRPQHQELPPFPPFFLERERSTGCKLKSWLQNDLVYNSSIWPHGNEVSSSWKPSQYRPILWRPHNWFLKCHTIDGGWS